MGLNIYASAVEIKQAYRKLALQFHPDKNASKEAAAIFIEVNEAYEVLGDALRKRVFSEQWLGVAVGLGGWLSQVSEGLHQGALGFVEFVQHDEFTF